MRSVISLGKHFLGGRSYDKASQWKPEMGSLYDLQVNELGGGAYDLQALRGKVSLVCNVASECGYTKCGYTFLEEEQQKYGARGFTVLGFPCNQFGGQEPGEPQDIRESDTPHPTTPTLHYTALHPLSTLTALSSRRRGVVACLTVVCVCAPSPSALRCRRTR